MNLAVLKFGRIPIGYLAVIPAHGGAPLPLSCNGIRQDNR